MRSSLFLDFTRRRFVVSYRRFGTICLSHLQGSSIPSLLGLLDCIKSQKREDCLYTSAETFNQALLSVYVLDLDFHFFSALPVQWLLLLFGRDINE
jgi:hypothetical protein